MKRDATLTPFWPAIIECILNSQGILLFFLTLIETNELSLGENLLIKSPFIEKAKTTPLFLPK